jgi:hypothetical protein
MRTAHLSRPRHRLHSGVNKLDESLLVKVIHGLHQSFVIGGYEASACQLSTEISETANHRKSDVERASKDTETYRLMYVTTGTRGLFLCILHPSASTSRLRLWRRGSIQSLLASRLGKSPVALFHGAVSTP